MDVSLSSLLSTGIRVEDDEEEEEEEDVVSDATEEEDDDPCNTKDKPNEVTGGADRIRRLCLFKILARDLAVVVIMGEKAITAAGIEEEPILSVGCSLHVDCDNS